MFKRFIKISILLSLVAGMLIPATTFAQNTQDPRCWEREECRQVSPQGFISTSETTKVCGTRAGKQLGFCLPVGEANTISKIGGKSSFTNIGTYVETLYQIGIATIIIISTIVIIASGFQWAASGGNASIIGSAQKRIFSAIIGLGLAVFSFVILQTVNPFLVNFRLPQAWLINTQIITPSFCSGLDSGNGLSKTADGPFDTNPQNGVCNQEYFVQGTGNQTCTGTKCPDRETCTQQPAGHFACEKGDLTGKIFTREIVSLQEARSHAELPPSEKSEHEEGYIAGLIGIVDNFTIETLTTFLTDHWEWEWANEPEIILVCNDGVHFENISIVNKEPSDDVDASRGTQFYAVSIKETEGLDNVGKKCEGTHGGVKGFLLALEMNQHFAFEDETHYIGKSGINITDEDREIAKDFKAASQNLFITLEELKNGARLDVNVDVIPNNPED